MHLNDGLDFLDAGPQYFILRSEGPSEIENVERNLLARLTVPSSRDLYLIVFSNKGLAEALIRTSGQFGSVSAVGIADLGRLGAFFPALAKDGDTTIALDNNSPASRTIPISAVLEGIGRRLKCKCSNAHDAEE